MSFLILFPISKFIFEAKCILIIFSVAFAGAYFGVLGMFLAVPDVALIKTIMIDRANDELGEK